MADQEQTTIDKDARLAVVRQRIDEIDDKLLSLLNERSLLSQEVGRIKAVGKGPIFKPQRELDILEKLSAKNPGPLPNGHIRNIWREIFSSSRSLQRPPRIAYLGPEGTFSYFASLEYLGHSCSYHACTDLPGVFEEVNSGGCDIGVVPLENSLQGTVGISFDLFLNYPVVIQAELYSRISHCLLSLEEKMENVQRVYSHPQPLSQCANWLRTYVPNAALIPLESTAAAARKASEEPGAAAISNGNLAAKLGLNILARRIEDASDNWTRFVLIASKTIVGFGELSHVRTPSEKTKTSVLFTLSDRPGALSEVLNLLAESGVNMRKLESRPLRGQCWKYVFFADVEQNLLSPDYEGLLAKLNALCTSFRILGAYAMGPQLDRIWNPDNTSSC